MPDTLLKTEQQSDINRVFDIQKNAAPEMAALNARERIERLGRILKYVEDESNVQALATAMHADFKKPFAEVLLNEVGIVISTIKFVKRNLRKWMKPKSVGTPQALLGARSQIIYEPKGSALIISPWNYPFQLALNPLIYAIAAGNTAVMKPSELSPHTSDYISKMMAELFSEKEVAVFTGGVDVSTALLALPFDHIYFTGSPAVGKIVMGAAAKNLASVTLELGGKSPVIVDESVNIKQNAERLIWGKLVNNGQSCIAPDYVLVHENIFDAFVEALKGAVLRLYDSKGVGIAHSEDYSRIINDRHFQRVKGLVADAVEKGGDIVMGGKMNESDRYIEPTIITNVSEDMALMQEEIFGPVLPVLKYRNDADVVKLIRKYPKPLSLYIAARNRKKIDYFLENTTAGGTVVNDYMLHYGNPHLPFGGVNNSGIGKSHGHFGFIEFSNERAILSQKAGTLKPVYPPYTNRVVKTIRFIVKNLL